MLTRNLWAEAVALVAPPKCACCGAPAASAAILCNDCDGAIGRLPVGTFGPAPAGDLAVKFAAFPFEGPVRELVHALKYRSIVAAAGEIARLIDRRLPPGLLERAVLVPVPAHPARERARGFNQSELIARRLGEIRCRPVWDCLSRTAAGPPQTGLQRHARLALRRDAIVFDGGGDAGPLATAAQTFTTNVVLLDDVTTTGVTLDVCAVVIRERLPSQIGAVAFASTGARPGRNTTRCPKLG
ncbi:MAG: hypothetical protein WBK99_05785 [Solirubrobacterales bacterium]